VAGSLWVLVGPSGSGKTSLAKALPEQVTGLRRAVTCTTRPRRAGEIEGVDYRFVSDPEFDAMLSGGGLVEWTAYGGAHYGLPADQFARHPEADWICVLDQAGIHHLRDRFGRERVRAVFLAPPTGDDLAARMRARGSTEAEIQARLATVARELSAAEDCDYRIETARPFADVLSSLAELIEGTRAIA